MRRSLAPAAIVLGAAATASAAPVSPSSDGEIRPLSLSVERRMLDGGGSLVTSRADGDALAACVMPVRDPTLPALDALEIERRGGACTVERRGTTTIWCVTLPRGELSLALWLAGRRARGGPRGEQGAAPMNGVARPRPGERPDDAAASLAAAPRPEVEPHPPDRPGDIGAAEAASLERLRELSLEGVPEASASPDAPRFVVSVVAAAAPEEIARLAHREVAQGTESTPPVAAPWRPRQTTERLSVIEAALSAPFVRWGWAIPGSTSTDRATLAVALDLLGGDRAARVPRLVELRAIARRGASWLEPSAGGSLGGVWLELSTRVSIDRARRFVDGTLKQLAFVGPSAREVRRAEAHLWTDGLRRWEDVTTRARDLAWAERSSGGATTWPDGLLRVPSVTPEAVRRLVRERFVDARRTSIEVYPPRFQADAPGVARRDLYTASPGDTLAMVASRFHVSIAALAKANDLDPRHGLTSGQALWIPPE